MKHLTVYRHTERSAHAGAGGHYQIASVEDEDGNDLTLRVNVGLHFREDDDSQLETYIKSIFGNDITVSTD